MNPEYLLTEVRAAAGGAQLRLTLERADGTGEKEELLVPAAHFDRWPKKGALTSVQAQRYRDEAKTAQAVTAGLRLLSFSGCSQAALEGKLRRRGISAEAAHAAAEELRRDGCLLEEDEAVRQAERDMEKLWGDRRILLSLRAALYGEEAIAAAAQRLRREPGGPRCAALMRRRRLTLPRDEADARRLFAVLSRYGYTGREIREALSLLEEERE